MPISNQYYHNQSLDLIEDAEALQLAILEELRRITNRTIEDPDYNGGLRLDEFTEAEVDKWEERSEAWVLAALPAAYLRGIQVQDSELKRLVESINPPDSPITAPQLFAEGRIPTSQRALDALSEFPKHHTAYSVMEADALGRLEQSRNNVLRSSRDMYRQVQAEALTPAFRTGETATRRDLSQRILDGFAKKGVTGIRYADGSQRTIESYAEMVGRTATRNASQQASMNRLAERGYDLVRVTQYAGASDLCAPWQGGVYSLSGESEQYPPFETAQFDGTTGLFHPNCGHSHSAYIPGASESIPLTTDPDEQRILNEMGEAKGNRFIYQQRQEQRRIERQIRTYKKRQAVSLDKSEREKAGRLVKNWQGRQRNLIDENPFLRRQYHREQI